MVISIFGSAVPSHLITFALWSNSAGHVTYKLNTCALHICSDMGRENREGGQIMHYGKMLMRREKEGRNEWRREDATLNSCPSVTVSLNAVYVQDNTLLRKLNVCTRYEFGLHCILFSTKPRQGPKALCQRERQLQQQRLPKPPPCASYRSLPPQRNSQ